MSWYPLQSRLGFRHSSSLPLRPDARFLDFLNPQPGRQRRLGRQPRQESRGPTGRRLVVAEDQVLQAFCVLQAVREGLVRARQLPLRKFARPSPLLRYARI